MSAQDCLMLPCGTISLQVFAQLPADFSVLYRELLNAEATEIKNPLVPCLVDIRRLKNRVKSECIACFESDSKNLVHSCILPDFMSIMDVKELSRWLEAYSYRELMLTEAPTIPEPGWLSNPNKFRWRWFQCDEQLQVLLPPDIAYRYLLFRSIRTARLSLFEKARYNSVYERFARACRDSRASHPYYGILPSSHRFAIPWRFTFPAMDSFLEEYVPLPAHDTAQVQMLTCSSSLEASGVSHPDLYGRCWIFIAEDTVPILCPPDAVFQYTLYHHAIHTSWRKVLDAQGTDAWKPIQNFLAECKAHCEHFTTKEGCYYGVISDRSFHSKDLDKALRRYENYIAGNSRFRSHATAPPLSTTTIGATPTSPTMPVPSTKMVAGPRALPTPSTKASTPARPPRPLPTPSTSSSTTVATPISAARPLPTPSASSTNDATLSILSATKVATPITPSLPLSKPFLPISSSTSPSKTLRRIPRKPPPKVDPELLISCSFGENKPPSTAKSLDVMDHWNAFAESLKRPESPSGLSHTPIPDSPIASSASHLEEGNTECNEECSRMEDCYPSLSDVRNCSRPTFDSTRLSVITEETLDRHHGNVSVEETDETTVEVETAKLKASVRTRQRKLWLRVLFPLRLKQHDRRTE